MTTRLRTSFENTGPWRHGEGIFGMRLPTAAAAALVAIGLAAPTCQAQGASTITGTVFANPGARSIGLGGAFAAIADDATAAFANPAGLVQILRPEISVELRFTSSMNGGGFVSGQGVSGLGFFSFVFPARSWALALYSHQMGSVTFGFYCPQKVHQNGFTLSFYDAINRGLLEQFGPHHGRVGTSHNHRNAPVHFLNQRGNNACGFEIL